MRIKKNINLGIVDNVHKKKCASDWLKMRLLQSCNKNAKYKQCTGIFKILSVLTFCNVFSCTLLTSNNMISLAIWCYMKFVNWSKTANCSRNFVVFGKFTCAKKHQIALRIVSLPY